MRKAYEAVACNYPKSVFPFMPFQPRWMAGLDPHERDIFSALLELSWCATPPCYLPSNLDQLRRLLWSVIAIPVGMTPCLHVCYGSSEASVGPA